MYILNPSFMQNQDSSTEGFCLRIKHKNHFVLNKETKLLLLAIRQVYFCRCARPRLTHFLFYELYLQKIEL